MTHPLQELRQSLDLTREKFADTVGRTRAFVSLVESGRAALGRKTVLLIVDRYRLELSRLGITAEDLLRGSRARGAA